MPVGNILEVQNGRAEQWKGKQEQAASLLWSVGCNPGVPISLGLCVLWHCRTWAVQRLAALTESLSLSVKTCCFSAFAARRNPAHPSRLSSDFSSAALSDMGDKAGSGREFAVCFTVGDCLQPSHLSAVLRGHQQSQQLFREIAGALVCWIRWLSTFFRRQGEAGWWKLESLNRW